jgi:hypothetical protein
LKKILLVQYSQTGQLSRVMDALAAPLRQDASLSVTTLTLKPVPAYPHPWPVLRFIDTFPEAVALDGPELEPLGLAPGERFDLVILGYPVWFLSPALPVSSFLQLSQAREILRGAPVVTVAACRDMWVMAQEQVKALLSQAGACLVGHVALVDEAGSIGSFLATPVWALTGKPGPHWGGLIPRAGVAPEKIAACSRFGQRIAQALAADAPLDEGLLCGLGAVKVNTAVLASEKAGRRSFQLWGSLLRWLGPQGSWQRKPALLLYAMFLILLILTVVPASFLLRWLLKPLLKQRLAAAEARYSWPSGS